MSNPAKDPVQGLPPMELPEDLSPVYSNLARISHTPTDMVIDFSRMLPGQGRMPVLSRVILSPLGAKLLLRALSENMARYEAAFGESACRVNPGWRTTFSGRCTRLSHPNRSEMQQFHEIVENARKVFDERTKVRDQALVQARQLTRLSALTIRAIHRSDHDESQALLTEAKDLVAQMKADLAAYPDLFFAGYTQDAIKEFAEASLTCALIENRRLPRPEELGIEYATYVNGMAETIGEMRRRCLDILRQGYSDEAERLLTTMDEIYNFLVTMDYPDAITNGLRRQTDLVRGIIERTRADLTLSQREQHLQEALQKFSEKFPGMKD